MDRWAKKPLDFEPGDPLAVQQHQLRHRRAIVQNVSGMPFFQFVRSGSWSRWG